MNAKTFIATTGNGLARAERGANGDWSVEFLLEDRDLRCLATDPLDPNLIYAGTQGEGVLRSIDRGRTWEPAGLPDQVVKALAVSPHIPGTIYAGTKPAAVHLSRDGGKSWTELQAFRRIRGRRFWFSPAEKPFTAYVQAIALSPADPNVVVAGVEFGAVVRSTDGGETWTGHRKGAVRDCHSLTFHATNGNWIYEAGGGGAAVSRDAGETWQQPKSGLDRHYGWACAADPARPEVWYISVSPLFSLPSFNPSAHIDGQANAAIFRSSGAAPWQKLGRPAPPPLSSTGGSRQPGQASTAKGGLPQPLDYMAYALLTDSTAPGHLYAGLSNGDVWHSTDHGDTWGKLPFNLKGIHRTLIML